jgi:hypothetical protein
VTTPIQRLLSLPAGSARQFARMDPYRAANLFVASDPPGRQIGSGGGTIHLLWQAWQAASRNAGPFESWLTESQTLIVHGSGESRRLPPYAALGKPLAPVPLFRGICGQRPDQVLLDLQFQTYEQLFRHAPMSYRVAVTCGDVLLRHGDSLPVYPEVDVLIVGLSASEEEARQHGVMICQAGGPAMLTRFLQKPSPSQLPRPGSGEIFYLDTGVWFLSQRAISVLLRKCGWQPAKRSFRERIAAPYDLYASFGPALGRKPSEHDPDIAPLSCAVLPLPDGRFYHFGTCRSLLSSVNQLQRPAQDRRSFGHAASESAGEPVVQHSTVRCAAGRHTSQVWIENSTLGPRWSLGGRNVLTGVPDNDWNLRLPVGACLDFVPISGGRVCVRGYGFDDLFKGPVGNPSTTWFGQPAMEWFAQRGIEPGEAGVAEDADIQASPLFPVLQSDQITESLLAWIVDPHHATDEKARQTWLRGRRLSARDLLRRSDTVSLVTQRRQHMRAELEQLPAARWADAISRLDLQATAALYAGEKWDPPRPPVPATPGDLAPIHDSMFRSAVAQLRKQPAAQRFEAAAFERLRRIIIREMDVPPVTPTRNVLDDQIVWGRSPVRLDLAGGWTDTPPYCLEHGGRVVNVAVDLNGQPPIQVFARFCEKTEVVVRSIDLGVHERIDSYEKLRGKVMLGSGFGIARAALALAGFSPAFHR